MASRSKTWPKCGHPKTPENTRRVGRAATWTKELGFSRGACKLCRQKIDARRVKGTRTLKRENDNE